MFVLGNFFIGLANVLNIVLTIFYWLILIRALISWVSPDPFNPIVRFLISATEPILTVIRKLMPFSMAIDISPIIAFLLIIFLRYFLVGSFMELGMRLQH